MKKWDVFISHASEDKDDVAIPLAQALRRGGVEVWLDQQELRLGDSLREKIDAGLANSRFGAVILSPNFLAKDWPRQELNALVAIEDANKKVILPVWHRIDKKTLAAYSPILADRIAEDTANGIDGVASKIMQVVFEADSSEPGAISPRLGQRFLALLKPPSDIEGISEFLSVHSNIVRLAFGSRLGWYYGTQDEVLWNQQFGMSRVDCCVGVAQTGTFPYFDWWIVIFGKADAPLMATSGNVVPDLQNLLERAKAAREWILDNPQQAADVLSSMRGPYAVSPDEPAWYRWPKIVVFFGRRQALSDAERRFLSECNRDINQIALSIRTYDWLIDAANKLPTLSES